MDNQNLPPDEQDIDSFSTPVQNFAFGGIANPVQRAMLRGSDKEYLGARQKELDAFEAQRLAYNDALTKYQEEVYNPYKAQTEAYNLAAQRYNEEVYNPYKEKYDAYEKAINEWNKGDRTTDYAGPEAPTLSRTFDLTAPKDPAAFTMTAPEVPFKVEDVQAYQQAAANRAREDAANRSVAIDVVSDPDRFNFGSMSVANRFMADGGEVKAKEKSAKQMLGEMDGGYEPDDAAILKMAQEISSKGKLTHAQIMEAVDRVAAAGRGGDELLAYLSPASVEILKKMGGSGSINPATGLHEFKGGVIGKIVGAIKRVFSPRSAAPAAAAAVEGPAAAAAPAGPTAAELAKQLDDANKAREALASQSALELTTLKEQQAAALKKQQEEAAAAQQLAIQNALKADADARAKAALPMSNVITGANTTGTGLTPAMALSLMYRSSTGGVPTAELEKYGGYDAVSKAATAAGFMATPKWMASYEELMKMPESEYVKRNKAFFSPGGAGYNNPDAGSYDGITPGGGYVPLPKSQIKVDPFAGLTASKTSQYTIPSNLSTIGSAGTIGQIDLGGPLDVGWSRYLDKAREEERQGKIPTGSIFGQGGERTDITAEQIPVTQPTLYQSKGVGQIGQVGDIGGINITGPAAPMVFGSSPVRGGNAATNPSSYFGMSQPSAPGINAGTTAIGSPDMPMFGAMNTMNALGQNKNLSPTMLGGAQNAGVMTDRLGNRIYAPGMAPLFGPPGFAKGGLADVNEFNMADTEDEPINTDPAGSAQKMLADLTGPTQSVTQVTESPNAKSVKRVSKKVSGGGGAPKGMSMEYEALTSAKDLVPQLKDDGSARSQMEALALAYKLRAQQATDKSRGFMRNTLGAPTLEQPTLTRGRLTARRFEKGGEAKKAEEAEDTESPSASKLMRRLALAVARGVPQAVTGMVDLAALPITATGRMKAEDVVGTTDYLTKRGLLPRPQEGLASESAELLSSMASPGGAAKAAAIGMLGPKGIIEAARRSQLFKGRGLEVPEEAFSAQDMLKMLREQGVDTERTWLRGKKAIDYNTNAPHYDYGTLEYLYNYQKRPNAIEEAMRDSRSSQASAGRTLSRQLEDRGATKFNTKGGVWLTDSPSLAQTYTGDKGYTIPVYAPRPDAVIDAKGEQWSDFYRKDKSWKDAFEDPKVRLVEVKNIIDAGPHWSSMISPQASEEELRALLTATNLFAKKPFDKRVVNRITGEPYKYKKGGAVAKPKKKAVGS